MVFDTGSDRDARALARLEADELGWLTTVTPEGQPQTFPIWYLWADGEILIYSGKRAPRNGNLGDRPLVSFNLNSDATVGDVVTMEGVARIDETGPPASANEAYLAKYRGMLDGYGWTPEYFAAEYPVVVRVTPTRWRVG